MTPALQAYLLVLAGVFGLVIGSFLNVVVYRVPAGIPLTGSSRCPACGAPVRAWQNVPVLSWIVLRGRCASCGTGISPRYPLVELATALAFVGVVWAAMDAERLSGTPVYSAPLVAAFLWFAAAGIALALVDLDTLRLPRSIVIPTFAVAAALFAVACVLGVPWAIFGRAAIGAAALYAFYFLLRWIRPDGMGGGDVTLAAVVGLYLGWLGWGALVVGAFAAFLLGGVYGVILLLTRRAGRRQAIPFGPWMLAGAWVGIVAGEQIARAYIDWAIPA
ncbi:prepilin peptidase [Microbacterium sp. NPDC078428]|uniref:prepilin peptidase n=1 Tax=Microbacterium sp. NPDC078428 TaxID=3364190 RepID=UPI0037C7E8EC